MITIYSPKEKLLMIHCSLHYIWKFCICILYTVYICILYLKNLDFLQLMKIIFSFCISFILSMSISQQFTCFVFVCSSHLWLLIISFSYNLYDLIKNFKVWAFWLSCTYCTCAYLHAPFSIFHRKSRIQGSLNTCLKNSFLKVA